MFCNNLDPNYKLIYSKKLIKQSCFYEEDGEPSEPVLRQGIIKNDLYKNDASHKYYLLVSKSAETPETFNKVCNILSEYAAQQTHTPATEAFLEEHYRVILKGNALQMLAEL